MRQGSTCPRMVVELGHESSEGGGSRTGGDGKHR
jgi:hypothetical protein